ncbi:methyltransferase [Janibacter sp. Soil728]|uniref:class I SAM-dependent DNA methyltransferase n=1 Tax=Janibacter sp. Soil728 TaxID=1736393 RepID=UPI0006FB4583|nr:methyltransferase domain-containing protein [Janibacter sp. Soil728]KRE37000.1 methyltransferase [Janibacter sp. Soil728]
MTSSDVWTAEQAARYDSIDGTFSPEVVGPTVDLLADLAEGGRALELAIGTGRIGVPLLAKGVPVTGIELSAPMVDQLRTKVSADELPVVVGDMATTRVPGEFTLVFLVFNTIGNLRTQEEQVECFRNAARHLAPRGRFVIEVGLPPLRRLVPGQVAVPFDVTDEHLGFDTFDLVTQQATSHHLNRQPDETYRRGTHNYRYVWPSELDLMARLAGMELESRHEDWVGTPFGPDSETHVSVWRPIS